MKTHASDQIIQQLASGQHGVVGRAQLRQFGVDANLVRRRVELGILVVLTPRVLAIAGSPDTIDRRLTAAVLDGGRGATLSHRSAGWRWGYAGFEPDAPIDVTGRRQRTSQTRSQLATLHQPRRLFPAHIVEVNGIPTTTPTRTLFDLANLGILSDERIERLLDRAWSERLLDHGTLTAVLADLAGKGRTGITLMRELIERRGPNYVAAQSNLEDRFRAILGAASSSGFECQVNIHGASSWIGRVDFVHPRLRLIVEVDSAKYHSTITDRADDDARQAELSSSGWTVLRVREHDIWHNPASVITAVRASRRTLSAGSGIQNVA